MFVVVTINIFHIYRKDGTSFFLHPFLNPEKLVNYLEKFKIEGKYGLEPRVEALTMFRNELYRQIEIGVKRWLGDVRFIPKFLISSAAFLVGYFFMSYVIPDPIAILDEIAIGLGAAILTYILLGRRDMSSKIATRKRLELRVAVDKIIFQESSFMKQVEIALHKNETESLEEVIKKIAEPAQQDLGNSYQEEAGQFIQLLENRFNFKKLKREERILDNYIKSESGGQLKMLKKMIEAKKLDFPLYAVYKSFKKSVSSSR